MAGGGRRDGAGRPRGAVNTKTAQECERVQRGIGEVALDTWQEADPKKRGHKPVGKPDDVAERWLVRQSSLLYAHALASHDYRTAAKVLEHLWERGFGKVRQQVELGGLEGSAPIRTEAVPPGLYQVEFPDGQIAIPAPAIGTAAAAPSNGGARARARLRARRRKAKPKPGVARQRSK